MTLAHSIYVAATLSLAIAACGGEAGKNETVEERGVSAEPASLTETVVHLEAGGSKRVETFTRAASRISDEGKAADTVNALRLTNCARSALTVWDQPGGTGNSICFFADPVTDVNIILADYPLGTTGASWNGRIRSFRAPQPGIGGNFWATAYYHDPDAGLDAAYPRDAGTTVELCDNGFYPGQPLTDVDDCQVRAKEVQLMHVDSNL